MKTFYDHVKLLTKPEEWLPFYNGHKSCFVFKDHDARYELHDSMISRHDARVRVYTRDPSWFNRTFISYYTAESSYKIPRELYEKLNVPVSQEARKMYWDRESLIREQQAKAVLMGSSEE